MKINKLPQRAINNIREDLRGIFKEIPILSKPEDVTKILNSEKILQMKEDIITRYLPFIPCTRTEIKINIYFDEDNLFAILYTTDCSISIAAVDIY